MEKEDLMPYEIFELIFRLKTFRVPLKIPKNKEQD